MRAPSTSALHWLVWLAAWLVLACHRGGPLTPLARPLEPAAKAKAPAATPPPISLTASDGTGLALATLHARAVLDEPLVLTELELSFDNPGDQRIEGRFELLLPPGASVTRFALQANGEWQEAEVVEKQQARETYETFLHEDRDPALLERDTGNRFSARVFPIEPYDRKHIIVSYVEALADPSEPWRLGLRGLPWLERYEVEVMVTDPAGATRPLAKPFVSRGEPTDDFVVPRAAPHDDGVRHGERVLARVQPLAGLELDAGPPIRKLTLLVDTSASRALDFEASLIRLAHVLRALARHAGTAEVQVLAFDQEVVPIYTGPLLGFGEAHIATLRARRPLGASNLGLALEALQSGEHQRVLLVSDGLVSAGEHSDAALRRQLHALGRSGVERLDALVLGAVRDEPRLQRLVAGPLPRSGVLLSPSLDPERVAARLVQPTLDGLRLAVPGARWWSPTRLDGLQPEDHVVIYAELPESQPLTVQLSGPIHRELEIPLRATESPLHEHGWRRAQIEGLVERLGALQDALESKRLRRHVVELSVRHRIFNDFTAFLVLERDEDYARFGLDRRALDDILVIGPSGAEVLHRAIEPEPEPEAEPEAEPEPAPAGNSVIDGVVRHSETREPIDQALVVLQCSCLEQTLERATNSRGGYQFAGLVPGMYTVNVLSGQADVSKMITLGPAAHARVDVSLDPKAEFRRTIRVDSRRAHRRRKRGGDMMSADSFAQRGSLPVPQGVKAPPPPPPPPLEKPEPEDVDGYDDGGPSEEDQPATPEPDAIVTETSVGRTITMEEMRNIPVGNASSRDFTAVVESAPTASRDSAGIMLGGSTGNESVYLTDGAIIPIPRTPQAARVQLLGTRVERSNLPRRSARAAVRSNLEPLERCYHRALLDDPKLRGRLVVQLRTDARGHVRTLGKLDRRGLYHDELMRCIERSIQAWVLPPRTATITQTLLFRRNDGPPSGYWRGAEDDPFEVEPEVELEGAQAYVGELGVVRALLASGERDRALARALAWRERDPIDVLALVALGDAAAARGDLHRAARAYGSILDLYPSRADMQRFAAGLLESLEDPRALEVAIDAYRQAVEQRPDQPSGRRNLAFALLQRGDHEAAFGVLVQALERRYPPDRFLGVQQVLRQDLGIVAAAWLRQQPMRSTSIRERLAALGVPLATEPSLQLVLTWETDVSDVDLHVQDAHGAQAHGESPQLPSGGELLVDVSNGFGPERFTVRGTPSAYPYRVTVHAYDRGPTGFGLGKVQVLHHDGEGGVHLEDRPFVAMEDDAWLDLGEVHPPPPVVIAN